MACWPCIAHPVASTQQKYKITKIGFQDNSTTRYRNNPNVASKEPPRRQLQRYLLGYWGTTCAGRRFGDFVILPLLQLDYFLHGNLPRPEKIFTHTTQL